MAGLSVGPADQQQTSLKRDQNSLGARRTPLALRQPGGVEDSRTCGFASLGFPRCAFIGTAHTYAWHGVITTPLKVGRCQAFGAVASVWQASDRISGKIAAAMNGQAKAEVTPLGR